MNISFLRAMFCLAPLVNTVALGQAESGNSGTLQEVVVTGVQASLNKAAEIKRADEQFVDAVVADDVGKLPDTNVAESLGRVSGVQIARGIGEGTDIAIRGETQNVILFNGRQIFDPTGRGPDQSDQLGTPTYGLLALVPSELISQLVVTKLSGANQIEGGIGGVVNIVTRQPLDQPGLHFASTATGTYDQLPGKLGGEFFGLASDTFADDKFGILVSGVVSRRTLAQQGLDTFSGWGSVAANAVQLLDSKGAVLPVPPNALLDLDARMEQIAETRDKDGVTATAQWKPSSGVELTWDTFYSGLNSTRDRHWIGFYNGGPEINPVFSPNNVLLAATADVNVNTNDELAQIDSHIFSTALNTQLALSESWSLGAGVDFNRSTTSYQQNFIRLSTNAPIPMSYNLASGDFGSFSIPVDLADPKNLNLAIFYDNLYTSATDDTAARIDAKWTPPLPWVKSIEAGVRYNELDTSTFERIRSFNPGISATGLSNFLTTFSNNSFLPGQFSGVPRTYLSANSLALTGCSAFTGVFDATGQAACATTSTPLGTYDVKEDFLALYGKVNFQTSLFNHATSGNIGLRVVRRNMTSAGYIVANTEALPNVFKRTDNEYLPSAVMRFEATPSLVLRLGAARVVAFPNTVNLNNGVQNFLDGTGSGGNPNLNPYLADQFDAAVEWYFAQNSVLSVGAFYNKVDSFILQEVDQETLPGSTGLVSVLRPANGSGAKSDGVEVLLQQPLSFLPDPFSGFGVAINYSYINSSTPVKDLYGNDLPLPGLSKDSFNVVAYFERGPASVRVAYNWRDKYLQGIGPSNTGVFFDSYKDLVATAKWEFSKNASVTIEGVNLLNSQLRTYNEFTEALRTDVVFGRIYKVVLAARF